MSYVRRKKEDRFDLYIKHGQVSQDGKVESIYGEYDEMGEAGDYGYSSGSTVVYATQNGLPVIIGVGGFA